MPRLRIANDPLIKVGLSLDKDTLGYIDSFANKLRINRSAALRILLQDKVKEDPEARVSFFENARKECQP